MTVRFSLIGATRDRQSPRLAWLRSQASASVEVIIIHNPGGAGLGAAYNLGLEQAQGTYCCFVHDDVQVQSPDWLARLARAVEIEGYDLVGVAGTTRLPRSGAWWNGGPGTGRGVVHHVRPEGQCERCEFGPPDDPQRSLSPAVSLDGILLFGRRDDFRAQPFDTLCFDGFHFYDSDLCVRWLLWAGRRLAVVHDLEVYHRLGASLEGWEPYRDRFLQRHGGLIPLDRELAATWQRNFAVLRERAPRAASALTGFRRPGLAIGFEPIEDGVAAWFGDRQAPLADPAPLPAPLASNQPLVFQGAGTGNLLDRTLRSLPNPILVIEPEGHLVCWLLARYDWSTPMREGRLDWWVSLLGRPDLAEVSVREIAVQLPCALDVMAAARRAAGPGRQPIPEPLWVRTGSTDLDPDFHAKLVSAIAAPGELAERVGGWPAPSDRVDFDVTVVSPSCDIFDDLARAFETIGCRTRLLRVPDRPQEWSRTRWLHALRQLRQSPSRATVLRNRVLLETVDPEWWTKVGRFVPGMVVSWWWDVPSVASLADWQDPSARLPALAFAREILDLLPAGSRWLPPAARSQFCTLPLEGSAESDPALPITFVGQSRIEGLRSGLTSLANALAEYCGTAGGLLADEINRVKGLGAIHEVISRHQDDLEHLVGSFAAAGPLHAYYLRYLLRMCTTAAYRLAAVKQLGPLGLRVFGDDGWVKSGVVPADRFGGTILPRDLPHLYRRSTINLNVNFMQVASTVNPKVLDVSAAGGVVLTDPRPELADLFPDPGCRPFTFDSLEGSADLVSDLLRRDLAEHRRALAHHVRSHHTLLDRARWIAQDLGMAVTEFNREPDRG